MNTANNIEVCSNAITKCYDFSFLPPHVIALILSYLNLCDFKSAALTCRAWHTGSCDPQFGYRFEILINNRTRIEENHIVRPIKSIKFDSVDLDRGDVRKLFRSHGHQIMNVVLYRCSISLTQLFSAIYYMPNIKVLKINSSKPYYRVDKNYYSSNVVKKRYSKIMENLSGIKLFEIRTGIETKLPGIVILLNACKHLETLVWNKSEYIFGPDEFITTTLLDHKSHCIPNTVRNLTIHRIDPDQSQTFFEKFINLELPHLSHLNLKEISLNYYDNAFREFCKKCRTIQSLQMKGCNELQLSDICNYISNLKSLSLSNLAVTTTNLIDIKNLRYLENLCLQNINDILVNSMCKLFHTNFEYLTRLNLDYATSDILILICANIPNLQYLKLILMSTTDCTPIFKSLIKLKDLSIVFRNISYVPSVNLISDEVFNITRLAELEYLFLTCYVPGITPILIKKLPRLRMFKPPFEQN